MAARKSREKQIGSRDMLRKERDEKTQKLIHIKELDRRLAALQKEYYGPKEKCDKISSCSSSGTRSSYIESYIAIH